MAYEFWGFDSVYQGVDAQGLPYGDRDWSADAITLYDYDRFTDGVNNAGNPDALLVTKGTGMNVVIGEGTIYNHGKPCRISAGGHVLAIPKGSVQDRIDRIVFTMDNHVPARSHVPSVKVGTPSVSPMPPSLTRTEDALGITWQQSVARVYVPAGATSIDQCTIIDERADATVCGFSMSRRNPVPPNPDEGVTQQELAQALADIEIDLLMGVRG